MQKPNWKRALVTAASVITLSGWPVSLATCSAQESGRAVSIPAGLQDSAALQAAPIQYLPFAHFAIPFDIDRSGKLPQEVHLWVSADQGKSWLKYASNSPDKRSFEFQAAAEGEYFFAVQTQDDRGASALASAPPMRILVDTTKPQIQVSADINSSGRLVIDYRIEDRFLSEDSVRLSYAVDGRDNWEEIRVGRLTREGNVWSGRIEQEMPRCHELQLKVTAADLAQNSSESIARYNAPRTASAGTGMQLASQRAPSKTPTLGQRDPAEKRETAPTPPTSITPQLTGPRAAAVRMNQLAGASPAPTADRLESTPGAIAWEPSSRQSVATPTVPPASAATPTPRLGRTVGNVNAQDDSVNLASETNTLSQAEPMALQAEELPPPTPTGQSIPIYQKPSQPTSNYPTSPIQSGDLELSADTGFNPEPASPALNSVLQRAEQAQAKPQRAQPFGGTPTYTEPQAGGLLQVESPTQIPAQAPSQMPTQRASEPSAQSGPSVAEHNATSELRSAVEPAKSVESENQQTYANDAYHSRSRSFSLDYSVDSLRGLPIADIELWGTDDRGNTWQKWGSDPDRESPFDVQVGDDGLYGFRMVIIGQNGMISNRPADGDPADMWINVDTKFPSVKITRALYGEGPDAGMLVIDYSCDDENMHERPISLAYSERPAGPWSTIATGLKNTGIYLWKADPNLPQHVYLRIQAVDRAGNVQEHRLELPINLRGLTPRGRIQGFRPIDPK